MTIRTRKNQYRGVNAHLHSTLQAEGGWESFHTAYIYELGRSISRELPPGYVINLEQSLQIREFHPDTGEEIITSKKPDVAIFGNPTGIKHGTMTLEPTIVLATSETLSLDPESYLTNLVVYEVLPDRVFGKPVTQIEILSPTNKPPGKGYTQYVAKREMLLKGGVTLIEVDFLHETASPVLRVPDYTANETRSTPYSIIISDPPDLRDGQTRVFGFDVDSIIPALELPLAADDTILVDFQIPYNNAFESINSFSYFVDYESLPENFDKYNQADQERIKKRINAVINAHKNGLDLETAPLPIDESTL
ncbi:MAG TPA: DUF4058 family protein [Aggregatilineales bacterium]|nr:DUF4058 family protein [Aggregatilineales bacterium]